MTTNYSESQPLSTKGDDRRFLSYVPWKSYKQKLFQQKGLFQSFKPSRKEDSESDT
jgi:hypothetical protein